MSLVKTALRPPRNMGELHENIDAMLEGRPFWSIAPVELGTVPDKLAKRILWTAGLVRPKYDDIKHFNFGAKRAIGDCLGDLKATDKAYFTFRAGWFRDDGEYFAKRPHIDDSSEGYRGTDRTAAVGYPIGGLAFEGPMQVDMREGVYREDELARFIAVSIRGYNVIPLEGQEPFQIGPGVVALSTECTMHQEPPYTSWPRWFGRQALMPTDMYSRETPFLEELYSKLVGSRS